MLSSMMQGLFDWRRSLSSTSFAEGLRGAEPGADLSERFATTEAAGSL
jgi:hypothetical protein